MDAHSSGTPPRRKACTDRPPKPYAAFPLTPHPNGSWQKKIRGRIYYFGRWGRCVKGQMERLPGDGWSAALELYKMQADDLHAGRTPRVQSDSLTVADLCNRFLTSKVRQHESGEITSRTFNEYKATTDRLVATFGKNRIVDDLASDDFEALRADMARVWGPVRLGNEVQKVRTAFKYAFECGLLDRPVRFGPQFRKPSASVLRRHRAARGQRMLEAFELRRLIELAPTPLKAMILLGVNCGLGNHDIAALPISAIDLRSAWLDFPRPKTGIQRRCPLWPETTLALENTLRERPTPQGPGAYDRVFVTARGREWFSRGIANPVSVAARKLLRKSGVERPGVGFYTLRHVFRTVADETRDYAAINLIMGHADESIAATYRERIEEHRLQAVVRHVRAWLWLSSELI